MRALHADVEFKIIRKTENDYLCKFWARGNPMLFVGTTIAVDDDREFKVIACEITNRPYSIKITGSCVLRLL